SLVPARVLNLVVVVDREWKGEIVNRLARVGRYHASRTILCSVTDSRETIDARVIMSGEQTGSGLGVLRERVELELGAKHLEHLNTIVDQLQVSDLPTVLWSPHSLDTAVESLLDLIDVILIDTDDPAHFDGPGPALSRAAQLAERVQVVDLAWLRTTPWRERLAAAFDEPSRRDELARLSSVAVRHNPGSLVSALLLAGWLASRLGWEPVELVLAANGVYRGHAEVGPGTGVSFDFEELDQQVPGIAGVTVADDFGFSLSLDRGSGGLQARQRNPAPAPVREWRVLGASRGEDGILGEGVRQALIPGPIYGAALAAARRFHP
ncbi:MAG: glucose-6-phosphate dehydrogenase assembly protein OpcA, partial [Solirubrobacterales bacterium]|nr:glucose-6-phosphate dehydrogenase assembly protein OpcA [Solirubrobacterales bacterium]